MTKNCDRCKQGQPTHRVTIAKIVDSADKLSFSVWNVCPRCYEQIMAIAKRKPHKKRKAGGETPAESEQ